MLTEKHDCGGQSVYIPPPPYLSNQPGALDISNSIKQIYRIIVLNQEKAYVN